MALNKYLLGISKAKKGKGFSSSGLDDSGLLVRYYLDEAASGTTPSVASDDSGIGAAMNMNIDWGNPDASWTEISNNRGLDFYNTEHNAIAEADINDTSDKVRDAIEGGKTCTLEFRGQIDEGSSSVGRVFGIRSSTEEEGIVMLLTAGAPVMTGYIRWRDNDAMTFTLPNTLHTWHIVFDSSEASLSDRITIYQDGIEYTTGRSEGSMPSLDETLQMSASASIVLMNRPDLARWVQGTAYYAAIYSDPFTAQRCADHHTIIAADDDTP